MNFPRLRPQRRLVFEPDDRFDFGQGFADKLDRGPKRLDRLLGRLDRIADPVELFLPRLNLARLLLLQTEPRFTDVTQDVLDQFAAGEKLRGIFPQGPAERHHLAQQGVGAFQVRPVLDHPELPRLFPQGANAFNRIPFSARTQRLRHSLLRIGHELGDLCPLLIRIPNGLQELLLFFPQPLEVFQLPFELLLFRSQTRFQQIALDLQKVPLRLVELLHRRRAFFPGFDLLLHFDGDFGTLFCEILLRFGGVFGQRQIGSQRSDQGR